MVAGCFAKWPSKLDAENIQIDFHNMVFNFTLR